MKQEVWDALLKRYGYQEVTDMLALMHSASVIRRAVRAMRQRKWTRKLAKIDPEMVEKVERLRKIQVRMEGDYLLMIWRLYTAKPAKARAWRVTSHPAKIRSIQLYSAQMIENTFHKRESAATAAPVLVPKRTRGQLARKMYLAPRWSHFRAVGAFFFISRNQRAPPQKRQEQRKANMRGGASTPSAVRGTDTANSATIVVNSEGEPTDDAFASSVSALVGATGIIGATPERSDPAERQSRPYEALLAGSLEKFESGHHGRGGGGGAGRSGVRPQTTGGTWKGSQLRRPPSSGPNSRPKFLGARGKNDGNDLTEEDAGGEKDRWREKGQQAQPRARPRARPKTAGAGSGGVQGVLARMGGYEEVGDHSSVLGRLLNCGPVGH